MSVYKYRCEICNQDYEVKREEKEHVCEACQLEYGIDNDYIYGIGDFSIRDSNITVKKNQKAKREEKLLDKENEEKKNLYDQFNEEESRNYYIYGNEYNAIKENEGNKDDIRDTVVRAAYEGTFSYRGKGLLPRNRHGMIFIMSDCLIFSLQEAQENDEVEDELIIDTILYSKIKYITAMLRKEDNISHEILLQNGERIKFSVFCYNIEEIKDWFCMFGVTYYCSQNERNYGNAVNQSEQIKEKTGIDIQEVIQQCNGEKNLATKKLRDLTGWDLKMCNRLIETELQKSNLELLSRFHPTKTVGIYMAVDASNHLCSFNAGAFRGFSVVYRYEDILSFELLEDGTSISHGGLGKAAIGGLAFGGAGAVVGAVLGKKNTDYCTTLVIKVVVNDITTPNIFIHFINGKIKKSSLCYQQNLRIAQECLSLLHIVCQEEKGRNGQREDINGQNEEKVISSSVADEIRKFKELADEGIITQEEFEKKKIQLLDI